MPSDTPNIDELFETLYRDDIAPDSVVAKAKAEVRQLKADKERAEKENKTLKEKAWKYDELCK
jgi:hypothetical protein